MAKRWRAVDFQRIRNGFGQWILDVLTAHIPELQPVWSGQSTGREQRPFVELDLTFGADSDWFDMQERPRDAPTSVLVELDDPIVDGYTYGYVLNARRAVSTGSGGEPVSDARDRLVTALVALEEPVTVAAVGAAELRITSTEEGGIVIARPFATASLLTQVVEATEFVVENYGDRRDTLAVNCYTRTSVGANTAPELAATLRASLQRAPTRLMLRDHGVTIWGVPSPPRNLSDLLGAETEQRVQFDVPISYVSRLAEVGSTLEKATIVGTVGPSIITSTPGV